MRRELPLLSSTRYSDLQSHHSVICCTYRFKVMVAKQQSRGTSKGAESAFQSVNRRYSGKKKGRVVCVSAYTLIRFWIYYCNCNKTAAMLRVATRTHQHSRFGEDHGAQTLKVHVAF